MSEELKGKLKDAALNIAEAHVKQAIDDVYAVAQVYVDDTANPLDNTILEGLKMLKSQLVSFADKIDGEEG